MLAERTISAILSELSSLYPLPKSELNFTNPFETLIAAMLSAQCTDKQVNIATERLFADYPNAGAVAEVEPETIEPYIRSIGLYHTKARNVVGACRELMEKYGGAVPDDMEALISLPGVGRKVANVVLANAYGRAAFAVDTHVHRVANRLGLARSKTPAQTEKQLTAIVPQSAWSDMHHRIVFHGRRVCHARKPECEACSLSGFCEYASGAEAID